MTQEREQLIEEITRLVIDALRKQQGGGGPVPIQPPVGTCTGDYSKFERPVTGGPASDPSPGSVEKDESDSVEFEMMPLSGVVTLEQLREAVGRSSQGKVRLLTNARLTPLANDYVRQHPEVIERVTLSGAKASAADKAGLPWVWWMQGRCPVAEKLCHARQHKLRPSSASRTEQGLHDVVADLASGVRNQRLAGGVLFVPTAALAGCYVNRAGALRGVVASHPSTVTESVTKLGANVLVVEYLHKNESQMAAMLDAFIERVPGTEPVVERQLADLHRS